MIPSHELTLSPSGVLLDRVRPGVRHILVVLPNICAPAALDALCDFLTGVSPFKPRAVQETLNAQMEYVQRE